MFLLPSLGTLLYKLSFSNPEMLEYELLVSVDPYVRLHSLSCEFHPAMGTKDESHRS